MSSVAQTPETTLHWKDFVPDVDVRWCPGCGDYAILNTVQKVFPTLGIPKENFVVVSGIGCSSRFPYYMNTYGMHTIHGRGPTFATGIKVANPDLSVWLITGDGDGLSIGGNHTMHLLRRNIDVNVLLFNNKIYGLTKGQYSPTSEVGLVSPSSPDGSIDNPLKPLCMAIASESTFVARTTATNPKHMAEVLKAAAAHKGTSFVEIMQNCVIFNDGTWKDIEDRDVRDDQMLVLEEGKPLIYGKNLDMGIRLVGTKPEVVRIGEQGITIDDILIHDATNPDPSYAYLLTQLNYPEFPTPVGVLRNVNTGETYTDRLEAQLKHATATNGKGRLQDLIRGGSFWEVDEDNNISMNPTIAEVTIGSSEEMDVMKELSIKENRYDTFPIFKVLSDPITVLLKALDLEQAPTLKKTDSIADAINILKKNTNKCIIIVDQDGKHVGLVSERIIMMHVANVALDRETTPVETVMTSKIMAMDETASIAQALNKLSIGRIRYLPINRKNGEVTLISAPDVLYHIHAKAYTDN